MYSMCYLSECPVIVIYLIRVLVKFWRGQGHTIVMYLDDGIGIRGSLSLRDALVNNVKTVLDECVSLLAHETYVCMEPDGKLHFFRVCLEPERECDKGREHFHSNCIAWKRSY